MRGTGKKEFLNNTIFTSKRPKRQNYQKQITITSICLMKAEKGEKRHQNAQLFEKTNKRNIAGRLSENSRNSFVYLQSQKKTVKKTDRRNSSFH